jgi:N,N'-diacetyllegionaminate synthase
MSKVFIIAEAGVNHNGSVEIAKKMIDAAVISGVDAIKFQTFKAEKLVNITAPKAQYQIENAPASETQFEMLKKLQLSNDSFRELFRYCQEKGILFLSSPFDEESLGMLVDLGLNIIKIPSGELTNLPYLRKIGRLNKRLIVSTGMAYLAEIEDVLRILMESGTKKENITILHCNTQYPTPVDDVNLNAMITIRDTFKVNVGYSDHTIGIEIAIAAVALGASVVEKHFTMDKNMNGPDHGASLEPNELQAMVNAIRNVEKAFGAGLKEPSPSELENRNIVRKSIIAFEDIKKGDLFTESNITTKRPATGISPLEWDNVIGRAAKRNFAEDELIEL